MKHGYHRRCHFQVLRANYERNNGHPYAMTAVTSKDDDGDRRK
jgi:hypothetical protein